MDELKTADAVREENKVEFPADGAPVTESTPAAAPVVPVESTPVEPSTSV